MWEIWANQLLPKAKGKPLFSPNNNKLSIWP